LRRPAAAWIDAVRLKVVEEKGPGHGVQGT
jgi:hypothetical protein